MHQRSALTLAQGTAPTFAAVACAEVITEAVQKHGELPPLMQEFIEAVEERTKKLTVEYGQTLVRIGEE